MNLNPGTAIKKYTGLWPCAAGWPALLSVFLFLLAARVEAADGTPLWTNRYDGPLGLGDTATAVAVDSSGNVFVTGYSYGSGTNLSYTTIKYSNTGTPLWTNRYDGLGNGDDEAHALAVDGNGNVFVTGRSFGNGSGIDYATVAYSGAGVPMWTNYYNGPGNAIDYASAVAVDGNGNVFVTGVSYDSGTGNDYATIKYSGAGTPLWTNRYDGPLNLVDIATVLAVDSSGNIFVTGYSYGSGTNYDYATIKYSSVGTPVWTNRYDGPDNSADHATAIAIDGSGNIFVTGQSPGSGSSNDYATVAYSGAGTPLWTNRYNGPGNGTDQAFAMAVDKNGNVFVTGNSAGSGTGDDYATIKYAAAQTVGSVVAWGYNSDGQATVPIDLGWVTAIAGGEKHTVAVKSNGTVVAWGYNFFGQTNVPVAAQSGVTAVAAGLNYTAALKSDGTVVAWGDNGYNQTNVPSSLSGVTAISGRDSHTLALKNDGTVVAWGRNSDGRTNVPVGLNGVTAIAAGGSHSVALKSDGTLMAWGWNFYGQTNIPDGLSGVTAIAGGGLHTMALKSDGTVVAWGNNDAGQTNVPAGLSGVMAIAAGYFHSIALTSNGTMVAWGDNSYGQTNNPSNLSGVLAIAAGSYHNLAITVAPVITVQPQSQAALVGSNLNFSVTAAGSTPLFYQWRKGGANITDATNTTYSLSSVTTNDSGNFDVVITNSYGSVTSSVAVLTVPSAIIAQVLTLTGGGQGVAVTNFGSIAPTNEVTVEFWAYTFGVADQSAFILEPDDPANRFQAHINWLDTGAGVTFWDYGDIFAGGRLGPVAAPANSISNWVHYALVASQGGNYMHIYTNGVLQASVASFNAFERGNYALLIGSHGYQGRLEEFRIWNVARSQAQIQANLVTPLVGNESGLLLYYRFDSTNGGVALNSATATGSGYNGSLSNSPTLTANATATAPVVTVPPQSQAVVLGANPTFSVTVDGIPPFAYRWRKGGVGITDATNSAYTLNSVAQSDVGLFDVVVTNAFGSVTSAVATLTVLVPDGTPLWTNRYNGPGNSGDEALSVVVDSAGNVIVTGYANNGANSDFTTIKYLPNGTPV